MGLRDEWEEGDALRVIGKEEARAILVRVEERMARLARVQKPSPAPTFAVTESSRPDPT